MWIVILILSAIAALSFCVLCYATGRSTPVSSTHDKAKYFVDRQN